AMIAPWVERTIARCRQALRDARLKPEQIDAVVLVGGSTRIPAVRDAVRAFFGREPYTALNPDLVVALGAAVQASILDRRNASALLL
ncbi:Hsp70 family protein, partial [Acinetobacter baumannii]